MTSKAKILEINDFCYEINGKEILKNINLSVKKGEFVGLIGPNGTGKTTLLKSINGINKGTGNIKIFGEEICNVNTKELAKKISLMHQNTSVSFSFSAFDIVMMGRYPHLKRFSGETSEDFKIARTYMDYTDTAKFEEKMITQVSGGERQRVLFAKVLAQESDIILLDEPTASLDIAHQEQIFKYAKELSLMGKTVIAAIHDLKIAAQYCSRLILMDNGEISADGCPEKVLTSDNVSDTYGVKTVVYKNNLTGLLDLYLYDRKKDIANIKLHVIGGGGSGLDIMRYLFKEGFQFSVGILWEGDSDLEFAEAFGIETIVTKPFSEVTEDIENKNIEKIKSADITILSNVTFGKQNLCNLMATKYAKKLIVVEDECIDNRDYTGGNATKFYNELVEGAVVTNSELLHDVI